MVALRLGILCLLFFGRAAHADSSVPGEPAGSGGVFTVRRMQGPYPSLDAVCAALRADATRFACSPTPAARLDGPPAPYREVLVLRARELLDTDPPREVDEDPTSFDLHLAVRLDAGWFVAREIAELENIWGHGSGSRHLDVKIGTTVIGRARTPALLVRVRSRQEFKWTSATLERLTVAGIGPSGTPAWLGPVLLSERGSGEQKEGPDFIIDRSFRWRIAPDGALVVARGRGDRDWFHLEPDQVRASLGRHPIVFP